MDKSFAIFILSYARADNIKTLNTLIRQGYTGNYFIVVGTDDPQLEQYQKNFGNRLLVFDKDKIDCDTADQRQKKTVVLYARNACFDFAKKLGINTFLQLDDDYNYFVYVDFKLKSGERPIKNLDAVLSALIEFFYATDALVVAISQGGDYIGGKRKKFYENKFRKSMNFFLCRTDRPFQFYGSFNEDVNFYTSEGHRGALILNYPFLMLHQAPTQKQHGGMTSAYLDLGTYVKSAYTLLYAPFCVKLSFMGERHRRLHHKIFWQFAVPKILKGEKFDKEKNNAKNFD
jgi:hypothetical protein